MKVNSTYHYVILRLAPSDVRGEVINMGAVLLQDDAPARVIIMAKLNKVRALDAAWTAARLDGWVANVHTLAARSASPPKVVKALGAFGLCDPGAVGMFMANTEAEVTRQLAEIKAVYVSSGEEKNKPKQEKKVWPQAALRELDGEEQQFPAADATPAGWTSVGDATPHRSNRRVWVWPQEVSAYYFEIAVTLPAVHPIQPGWYREHDLKPLLGVTHWRALPPPPPAPT